MHEIIISSTEKNEIIDITAKVEELVSATNVKEGICLVYAPHATATVMVMEADGAVEQDVLSSLSGIVPKNREYVHQHGSEPSHGAAHVKSSLFSPSQSIPISSGKLQLGTWQSIVFCEFDGPRAKRRVLVQVVGR